MKAGEAVCAYAACGWAKAAYKFCIINGFWNGMEATGRTVVPRLDFGADDVVALVFVVVRSWSY